MTEITAAEFGGGRQRAANYIEICNNIADSYPDGVSHGLQKDAIQNAVDAGKGRGLVRVEFRLVENDKGKFLTVTDSGTSGLTGPVLEVDDYEEVLPEDSHWARFESFAFTKDSPDAIGARGQGKFIFLRAAKDYTMYYDTLRDDGVYRVGATKATRTGCPILPADEPWEGERGAEVLMEKCGLEPLRAVGTRVIVVDPIDELLEQLANGEFVRAIQETWFREIEKQRVEIVVDDGNERAEVGLPSPYPLPIEDANDRKVWILGEDYEDYSLRIATGERYRVKRFHAVYLNKGTVPEDMQGIAIVHNGMKIMSLEMTSAPPQVRERVTGYIEFDRELDHELRKGENQHPNHYDLKWRRRLPQAIKQYINTQLTAFGKQKLGLGVDPREIRNRRRTNAEEWAMRQLVRHAKDLDLFGARGTAGPRPDIPPSPPKPMGVAINNFAFPEAEIAPRVNWGQEFTDLGATAYNRTEEDLDVSLSVTVLRGDSVFAKPIDRARFELNPKSEIPFGPFRIVVNRTNFPEPGEYRLKASLFDANTGDRIDHVARRFWVEQDPPLRQPFQLEPVSEFLEPNHRRQWLTSGSVNSSATLYYNTRHPAYRIAEDEDEARLADYILEVVLEGAIDFVLKRPDGEDGTPDYHPLQAESILGGSYPADREEVPAKTYAEVSRYVSELRWRMLEGE